MKHLIKSACALLLSLVVLSPSTVCSATTTTSDGAKADVTDTKTNLVDRPNRELFPAMTVDSLDDNSRDLANKLEIYPLLLELYTHKNLTEQRRIVLRQKIQETILEAYFDAESVRTEAEREQFRLSLIRETLISRRDRSVEVNNASNFIMSGTLNTIGSILGFPVHANPVSGNLNQMLSGVVSTSMSMYALKQNSGGKTKNNGSPTVLAELFGRPTDYRTAYPESVWRFIHSNSMEFPTKTRVQLLEERWISRHYLEPHGTAGEIAKIDAVCGRPGYRMSINDLSDQISMIAETEGAVELMNHHLRDLLRMIDSDLNIQ